MLSGTGLFVVITGSVDVQQEEDDGTILHLASAKPGEFIGELALLDDSLRTASAIAVDDTSVVALYRTDLSGADLSSASGLEQDRLDMACGDAMTKLPKDLTIKPCKPDA